MSNYFKYTCFLLQTWCFKVSHVGEPNSLGEVKVISWKNLEIGVLGVGKQSGKPIHQEAFGCRECWVQWRDLANGHMSWEAHLWGKLTTKAPFSQGCLLLRNCFSGACGKWCKMQPRRFDRWLAAFLTVSWGNLCLKWAFSSFAACGNKVDPVYETLRFGTSLAQRTKKSSSGSGSDSPHRTSVNVLCLLQSIRVLSGRAVWGVPPKCIIRVGVLGVRQLPKGNPKGFGALNVNLLLPTPSHHFYFSPQRPHFWLQAPWLPLPWPPSPSPSHQY